MIFPTRIAGIPCQCEVLNYSSAEPLRITGSGYGDCDPPSSEEFEFRLLDISGYPAPWLEAKMTSKCVRQLKEDFLLHQ